MVKPHVKEADAIDLRGWLRGSGERRDQETGGQRGYKRRACEGHSATAVCWPSTALIFCPPSILVQLELPARCWFLNENAGELLPLGPKSSGSRWAGSKTMATRRGS